MNLESLDDIRNLINSGTETDSIEFKKTTGQLERGMETLCAFLNGTGGTVLFGVTDEGKIVGQDIAGKTKETIGEAVSRLEPNASVQVFYVSMPDSERKVIALHVENAEWNARSATRDGRICA